MPKERALVLGGGGPVGIAWESGLVAGLKEGGVDVTRADYFLGTSAGSFVCAQLARGDDPASLAAAQIEAGSEQPKRATPDRPASPPDLTPLMTFMAQAPAQGPMPTELLKEIGQFSLGATTIPEDAFVANFGGAATDSLPWPENFACTAVDTQSGEFKVWTRADGIPLGRGIASSCSVPGIFPPISIAGRRWMDGGMRSSTSADLAKGYRRVIVVAVTTAAATDARAALLANRLASEQAVIAEGGGTSELITPDANSLEAFGPNLMDASRRAAATRAGLEQGRREAARLASFWN